MADTHHLTAKGGKPVIYDKLPPPLKARMRLSMQQMVQQEEIERCINPQKFLVDDEPVRRAPRKASLLSTVKAAQRAGLEIGRVEIDPETGKITIVIGKPQGTTDTETAADIRKLM